MHIWDEPSPALMQFDVYSCGEFDVEKICNKIKQDFGTTKIEYIIFKQRNWTCGFVIFAKNTFVLENPTYTYTQQSYHYHHSLYASLKYLHNL